MGDYLASAGLNPVRADFDVPGAHGPSGTRVRVRLTYPDPVPGLPNPVPLGSQAVMRIE